MPGFSKSERLYLKKDISTLFEKGEKWHNYPIRTLLNIESGQEGTSEVCMLVSVSKRNFKKAVDRNRLKRQIREAYRLNKHILYQPIYDPSSESAPIKVHIGLIYTSKVKEPWELIEKKVIRCLHEINQKTIQVDEKKTSS